MFVHEAMIAFWMLSWDSDVFVLLWYSASIQRTGSSRTDHIEGDDIAEGDFARFESLHKVSVDNLWTCTGRQTKYKRTIGRGSEMLYAFFIAVSTVAAEIKMALHARTMYCAMYLEAWSALSLIMSLLDAR